MKSKKLSKEEQEISTTIDAELSKEFQILAKVEE